MNFNTVVNIFVKNPVILQHWKRLARSLGLTALEEKALEDKKQKYDEPYEELFLSILRMWKMRKGNEASFPALCEVLRTEDFIQTAESLEDSFSNYSDFSLDSSLSFSINFPSSFGVGKCVENFMGREDILLKFNAIVQEKRSSLTLITGLGGVGKTELCRKFANELFDVPDVCCTWIRGSTKESLRRSIVQLADEIGYKSNLTGRFSKSTTEIFNIIADAYIKTHIFWVILIDNVDDTKEEITDILKTVFQKIRKSASVFITSRKKDVLGNASFEPITLSELPINVAHKFVLHCLEIAQINDAVEKLCAVLQNYPLALQQAVAYIKEKRNISFKGQEYGIKDYLIEFESSKDKLLDYQLSSITHDYDKTVLTTWNITIDYFKTIRPSGRIGNEFLQLVAYMDPDGIPIEFLKNVFIFYKTNVHDEKKLNDALILLKNFSMIKIENDMLSVHRLVQEVMKLKNANNKVTNEFTVLRDLTCAINSEIQRTPFYSEKSSDARSCFEEIKLNQFSLVWSYAANKFERIAEEFKSIPCQIAARMFRLEIDQQAMDFCEREYERAIQQFGEDHITTLSMLGNILHLTMHRDETYGSCLLELEELLERVKKLKKFLVEEKIAIMKIQRSIAECLGALGLDKESVDLYEHDCKETTELFGDHEESVQSKASLAHAKWKVLEKEQAIKLMLEVWEWEKIHFVENPSKTLTTTFTMAKWFLEVKNNVQARRMCKDCLKFELDIPTKRQLALILHKLGDWEEAKVLFEEVFFSKDWGVTKICEKNVKNTLPRRAMALCKRKTSTLCSIL